MGNVRWLIFSFFVSWAASCGQKGPLELPQIYAPITTGTPQAFWPELD